MEINLCSNCKNYLGELSCMAFKKIPSIILDGENDYSKPTKEQKNTIVFEQKGDNGNASDN